MKYLEYLGLRLLIFLIQISPFWLLYLLSDFFRFILYQIIGYRKKIVRANLVKCFPEKTPDEILRIQKDFYKNLCDVILETFKGMTMSKATLIKRYHFKNPEMLNQLFDKGIPGLMIGGHITNWEWGVLSVNIWAKHQAVGIYKPLKNKYMDAFFKKTRGRWNLELVAMADTRQSLEQQRAVPGLFYFIADQTPSNLKSAHWVKFFNQDTVFLSGVDRIARATGLPVFFFDIKRVKRGHYELEFEPLCQNPKSLEDGAITQLFASRLEKSIRQTPANWLWSHKRWKHNKG